MEFSTLFIIFMLAIPAIATLIAFAYSRKYLKKPLKKFRPVEYAPPKSLSSAEVGYLFRQKPDLKDTVSLLPYLASKGYLKIANVETDQKNHLDDKIYILKEYSGDNENISDFFDYLNANGKPTTHAGAIKEISSEDLRSMLKSANAMQSIILHRKFKTKVYANTAQTYLPILLLYFLTIVVAYSPGGEIAQMFIEPLDFSSIPLFISVPFWLSALVKDFLVFSFPALGIGVILYTYCSPTPLASYSNGKRSSSRSWVKQTIFLSIWSIGFIGSVFCIVLLPELTANPSYIPVHIFGILCALYQLYLALKISRTKTERGEAIYQHSLAYREYLKTVEKDRVKFLAKHDPSLYYETLAFAYVLEVSDYWVEELEKGIPS